MNDKGTNNDCVLWLKEEYLRWVLSVLGGVLLYLPAVFLIEKCYHPDIAGRLAYAEKILIAYPSALPEPMEAMLFRVAIVIIFTGMLLCYTWLRNSAWIKDMAKSPYYLVVSVCSLLCATVLIYFDFAALTLYPDTRNGQPLADQTNFAFYFDGLFFGKYIWLYALVLFPLIAGLFFIAFRKYRWDEKKAYRRIVAGIGYTFAAALLLAIVLMNTCSFPYTWQNKTDFNAVYYSVTQVYAGLPMLVDGFTDTYGLYPHFLVPIFHVTGLSIFKFSLAMALLTALAFVFNFIFLRRLIRNKVILFSGFFTMVFFSYLNMRLLTPFDSVFAYYPIRYIIPSTLSLLAPIYFTKRAVKLYWFISLLMACFVLWNPEFGVVCYGSWVLANVYHDWYNEEGNVQVRKILSHLAYGIGVIIGVFYAWKLIIYICYGAWPEMSLLFSTIAIFENVGVNLLPMSLVHPWNIMGLILCLGFLYAIAKWSRRQSTPMATTILLVSLIGLGSFFYFQGRSTNWGFSSCSGYCIMLLTILGDKLWQKIKTENVFPLNALFAVFLFIVSFSFFETALDGNKIYALIYQEDVKAEQALEQTNFEGNKEYFLNNTAEKEKVHIITTRKYQSLYIDGSKRKNALNPGLEDMFLDTDLARLEQNLRDSSFDVFIEPNNLFKMQYLGRCLEIIGASYQHADDYGSMYLLKKRNTPIPPQTFFTNTDAVVIHRKYTGDTTGINSRVRDAEGTNVIALNNEFSIEVLFYPGVQLFPYAAVIGNDSDKLGFVLCKQLFSPNYLFEINNTSFPFPVPFNKWIYLVANVFPDHADVYENGSLVTTYPLSTPVRQSAARLCIGNLGYMHYFLGVISEVALANKATGLEQLQQTWGKIDQAVNK